MRTRLLVSLLVALASLSLSASDPNRNVKVDTRTGEYLERAN